MFTQLQPFYFRKYDKVIWENDWQKDVSGSYNLLDLLNLARLYRKMHWT